MGGREDEQGLGDVKRCVLMELVAAFGEDFGLELPLGKRSASKQSEKE